MFVLSPAIAIVQQAINAYFYVSVIDRFTKRDRDKYCDRLVKVPCFLRIFCEMVNDCRTNPLVLIPAYNPGALLLTTVRGALAKAAPHPVWVVDDGSDDGSIERLVAEMGNLPRLQIHRVPKNRGKGHALWQGAEKALEAGFTHALTMDADNQHDPDSIPRFLETSRDHPDCLIMGIPQFGEEAPWARVWGRKLTIFWTDLETGWQGLGDTLFGFRVYPLQPFCRIMRNRMWAQRFDFDPEIAVRLCWEGIKPLQLETPVRYHKSAKRVKRVETGKTETGKTGQPNVS